MGKTDKTKILGHRAFYRFERYAAVMNGTLLKRILSTPTAPFREGLVSAVVSEYLEKKKIPFFKDPYKNLIVGAQSKAQYLEKVSRRSKEPLRVYVAHMDHPGFHGVEWLSPNRLSVQWHGGSPTKDLVGSKVWLANSKGYLGEGKFVKAKLIPSKRALESAVVQVKPKSLGSLAAKDLYGGMGFRAPVWESGNRLYTKAADDLAGVYTIVRLAESLYKKKTGEAQNFLGLLTRAEEVGFIGATEHFGLAWLEKSKRPVLCVSLEASRTLPGAEIGKGPVVRLGDRMTVFDPNATQIVQGLAQRTLKGNFQRKLMDGGACEATAATAFGLAAVGLSLPLGNYHNQNFEGGPDSRKPGGSAPEFVDLRDIKGMEKLCRAIMESGLPWDAPWKNTVVRLKKSAHRMRGLMELY